MDQELEGRIFDLCEGFEDYLNEQMPFSDWAWHIHRETITMRNQFNSVSDAIDSYDFIVKYIGYTLVAWGMDGQAAELAPRSMFFRRIKNHKRYIVGLERISASYLRDPRIIERLWRIIHSLGLSQTNSQIVTGSKALHHLLPRLLPPIDREYTSRFFTPPDLKNVRNPNTHSQFKSIATGFGYIVGLIEMQCGAGYLPRLVGTTDWATSETKLIDNAIIGYVKRHNLQGRHN